MSPESVPRGRDCRARRRGHHRHGRGRAACGGGPATRGEAQSDRDSSAECERREARARRRRAMSREPPAVTSRPLPSRVLLLAHCDRVVRCLQRRWLLSRVRSTVEHLRPTCALNLAGQYDKRETREQCLVDDLGCHGFALLTQPQMTVDTRALRCCDASRGVRNQRRQALTPRAAASDQDRSHSPGQRLLGAINDRRRVAGIDLERLGDLGHREFTSDRQIEHRVLPALQRASSRANDLSRLLTISRRLGPPPDRGKLAALDRHGPPNPVHFVDRQPISVRKQPRPHPLRVAELLTVLQRPHERRLQQILRHRQIPHRSSEKIEDRRRITLVQSRKRRIIPRSRRLRQHRIRDSAELGTAGPDLAPPRILRARDRLPIGRLAWRGASKDPPQPLRQPERRIQRHPAPRAAIERLIPVAGMKTGAAAGTVEMLHGKAPQTGCGETPLRRIRSS